MDRYTRDFTIENDDRDPARAPYLSITNHEQDEGDDGRTDFTFTVTREGGDLAEAVTVRWTVTKDTDTTTPADANDFDFGEALTDVVTIEAGATDAEIFIPVNGDLDDEPDETFIVTLSDPSVGTVLPTMRSATGTIRNDDAEELPEDAIIGTAGPDTIIPGRVYFPGRVRWGTLLSSMILLLPSRVMTPSVAVTAPTRSRAAPATTC